MFCQDGVQTSVGIKSDGINELPLPKDFKAEQEQVGQEPKTTDGVQQKPEIVITLHHLKFGEPKGGGFGLIFKGKMQRADKAGENVFIKVVREFVIFELFSH